MIAFTSASKCWSCYLGQGCEEGHLALWAAVTHCNSLVWDGRTQLQSSLNPSDLWCLIFSLQQPSGHSLTHFRCWTKTKQNKNPQHKTPAVSPHSNIDPNDQALQRQHSARLLLSQTLMGSLLLWQSLHCSHSTFHRTNTGWHSRVLDCNTTT